MIDMTGNVWISTIYSVAVGVAIFFLASISADIMPNLNETSSSTWPWVGFFLSILLVLNMSAFTNVLAISWEDVARLDARNHIEQVQKAFSRKSVEIQDQKNIVMSLTADKKRYLMLAEKEKKTGLLSGAKGSGTVSTMYEQSVDIINAAIIAISANNGEIEKTVLQASAILSEMRNLLEDSENIDSRILTLRKMNRDIQTLYEKLASYNIGRVVSGAITPLENVIAISTSSNQTLKKKQKAILAEIRQDFRKTKEKYTKSIAGAAENAQEEGFPVWEHYLRAKLVVMYASHIIPFIAAGVAFDLTPFLFVLFLVGLRKTITQDEAEEVLSQRKYTVDDLQNMLSFVNKYRNLELKD